MELLKVINILSGITRKEKLIILKYQERYDILYDIKKQIRKIINLSSEVRNNKVEKAREYLQILHFEALNIKNILQQFYKIYNNDEIRLLDAEKLMNSQLKELLLIEEDLLLDLLKDKKFETSAAGRKIEEILNNILKQNKLQNDESKLYDELTNIINNFKEINIKINNLIKNIYTILDFYSIIDPNNKEQYYLMEKNEQYLNELYEKLKEKLIEEKDNIIKPLLKLIDNKSQIFNMIQKLKNKTLITTNDIKKDISTFSDPEETREYLSRICMHLNKVEDSDYIMRLLTKLGLKADSLIKNKSYQEISKLQSEISETKSLINIEQGLGLNFLYTKKYLLNTYLKKLILEVSRNGNYFSIAFLDLDNFKSINDNYGHQFGDNVLKYTLNFIRDKLRINDEIFRYGGEEFIIVLKDIDNEITFNIINKIRKEFSEDSKEIMAEKNSRINIEESKKISNLTFSAGISTLKGRMMNERVGNKLIEEKIIQLIKLADIGVYKAKKDGRNKIISMTEIITL